MPPTTRNHESSISFFEESFQVSNDGRSLVASSSPQHLPPVPQSPLSPNRSLRRRPQPALPKIPRGSLRGNAPPKVMNVKQAQSRSNSNSPTNLQKNVIRSSNSSVGESSQGTKSVTSRADIKSFVGNMSSSVLSQRSNSPTRNSKRNLNHNSSARIKNSNHLHNSSYNLANSISYMHPPALLPAVSGGSTIATEDVFLDEDNTNTPASRRRRSSRTSLGSAVDKAKMLQLLHAADNDQSMAQLQEDQAEVDVDELIEERSRGTSSHSPMPPESNRPAMDNRRYSSTSMISGITEDVPLNDMMDMDEQTNPLLLRNKHDDEDEDDDHDNTVAQEQAVAIATDMFKRSFTNDSDDQTVSSRRSVRSHRSRDMYDPDLEFLHSSVIEAAMMEKEFHDEDDLLGDAMEGRQESCWSRSGGMVLCVLLLIFWGGVIPYCIVRYHEQKGQEVPEVLLTAPPTNAPLILTPSQPTPLSPKPTWAPTPPLQTPAPMDNATFVPNVNVTESLETNPPAPNLTTAPSATPTNLTTLPPTFINMTFTTLPPTIVFNMTFNETTANSTVTDAPSAVPTLAPTEGAIFTPATRAPTMQPTSILPPTFNLTLPSNTTLNITYEATNVTINTTTAPTTTTPTVSPSPTATPSFQPTAQPEVVFPNYTLRAFNNPGSPQSKAFSWMLRDPNFGSYTPNRMRQRFALAVLYYATNGDDWNIQQTQTSSDNATTPITTVASEGRGGLVPWLSYGGHECDWYHKRSSDLNDDNRQASNALLQLYSSNLRGVVVCENEYDSNGVFRTYKALWLESAGLQGTLPPELAMLTSLQQIQMSDNDLFGSLAPQWFWDDKETKTTWQTSLQEMCLKNNSISGRVPPEFGLASNLKKLDLQQNRIQRRIPSEIGLLTRLEHLLWNDNLLSGTIPSEIGRLSSMTAASWNNNRLSGRIPSQVGQCTSLQEFYVGENLLSGPIPWELMFLQNSLVDLHLYSNQLNQRIPTRLGLLTKLRWFHVANNELTGSIPSELGRMTMMQLFQVDNNALEGELPSQHLAAWEMASRVWLHNNTQLYGTIPHEWCPGGVVASNASGVTNGTIVDFTEDNSVARAAEHSVDIRVDCDRVSCSCVEGCACTAMSLGEGEGRTRLLRGSVERGTSNMTLDA